MALLWDSLGGKFLLLLKIGPGCPSVHLAGSELFSDRKNHLIFFFKILIATGSVGKSL